MSEISKEAWEEARAILGATGGSIIDIVAAALQRHLDATQKATQEAFDAEVLEGHKRIQAEKRAEAAEARVRELEREIERWKELHGVYQGGAYREEDRKNAAIASKAELIREVEEYLRLCEDAREFALYDLPRILDKHRGKP